MNDTIRRLLLIGEFKSFIDDADNLELNDFCKNLLENVYRELVVHEALYFELLPLILNNDSKPQEIKKKVIGFVPPKQKEAANDAE